MAETHATTEQTTTPPPESALTGKTLQDFQSRASSIDLSIELDGALVHLGKWVDTEKRLPEFDFSDEGKESSICYVVKLKDNPEFESAFLRRLPDGDQWWQQANSDEELDVESWLEPQLQSFAGTIERDTRRAELVTQFAKACVLSAEYEDPDEENGPLHTAFDDAKAAVRQLLDNNEIPQKLLTTIFELGLRTAYEGIKQGTTKPSSSGWYDATQVQPYAREDDICESNDVLGLLADGTIQVVNFSTVNWEQGLWMRPPRTHPDSPSLEKEVAHWMPLPDGVVFLRPRNEILRSSPPWVGKDKDPLEPDAPKIRFWHEQQVIAKAEQGADEAVSEA